MKKKHTYFILFVFTLFIETGMLYAQFQQLPYQKRSIPSESKLLKNQKVTDENLSLPFWDDFSNPILDSSKWINEGAHVSKTTGNSAPSIGVLVLDGINEAGRPYSNITLQEGIADAIFSKPINLLPNPVTPLKNVYLSFFWQPGGKGELPDEDDFLSLLFKTKEGRWETIWEINGGIEAQRLFFTQEIVFVDPMFHHEGFQFKFEMRGKLSGPFDSWILDYVYLNDNRSANDLFTEDRALSALTTRPFKKHAAVPFIELQKHQEKYLGSITNEFKNLNNRFRAMDYSIEIKDKTTQETKLSINNRTAINPVPLALERRNFSSKPLERIPMPEKESDYELLTYLSTGDNFLTKIIGQDTLRFPSVDFRKNDTIRVDLPIRDFFAYDDGEVDYAAGINQRSGMLALKYEVFSPSFLKGISINFPNSGQIGSSIDLLVWTALEKEPIYTKSVEITAANSGEFVYYEIDENVKIEGNFYIGFMQFTNNFLYVGLDKSNDTGDDIYYNVTGNWEQNKFVEGSLMMRPHISENPLFRDTKTQEIQFSAYPNPVTEKLFVEGNLEIIGIYDSFGRKVPVEILENENKKELNFVGLKKGIYLLTLVQNNEWKTLRILVK